MATYDREIAHLASLCDIGRLEKQHLTLLLNKIDADQTETVDTLLLAKAMRQLQTSGRYSAYYVSLLMNAIAVRAASANASIGTATEKTHTRRAIRYLRHCGLTHDTVEALVVALVD